MRSTVALVLFVLGSESGYFYPKDCEKFGEVIKKGSGGDTTDSNNLLNTDKFIVILSTRHLRPTHLEIYSKGNDLTMISRHPQPMLGRFWVRTWDFNIVDNKYVHKEDNVTVYLWTVAITNTGVLFYFCIEDGATISVMADVATESGNHTLYEAQVDKFRENGLDVSEEDKPDFSKYACLCLRPAAPMWDRQTLTDLKYYD